MSTEGTEKIELEYELYLDDEVSVDLLICATVHKDTEPTWSGGTRQVYWINWHAVREDDGSVYPKILLNEIDLNSIERLLKKEVEN